MESKSGENQSSSQCPKSGVTRVVSGVSAAVLTQPACFATIRPLLGERNKRQIAV
jgi:hypothetical protein